MVIMTVIKQQVIVGECRTCDYTAEIPVTNKQMDRYKGGELIQNVLPHVSPGDRELLISGICGNCFDNMFKM